MPRARRSRWVAAPRPAVWDVVSDPHHLPRWWPKVDRVENVHERKRGKGSAWTSVLKTKAGRGVRAEFRCTYSTDGRAYGWEQQIEGTPFAKVLRSSALAIELEDQGEGTLVRLEANQRLRGLSRFGGGFMLKRATSAQLDEALEGLALAVGGPDAARNGR